MRHFDLKRQAPVAMMDPGKTRIRVDVGFFFVAGKRPQ